MNHREKLFVYTNNLHLCVSVWHKDARCERFRFVLQPEEPGGARGEALGPAPGARGSEGGSQSSHAAEGGAGGRQGQPRRGPRQGTGTRSDLWSVGMEPCREFHEQKCLNVLLARSVLLSISLLAKQSRVKHVYAAP